MNKYLTREIWKMRKNIKTTPGVPAVSLQRIENKVYQLLFLSCGCEYACTFCNYGFDYKLTKEMVMPELKKIKLEDFDIAELELEANGSFLSEREIPYDLFLEVLEYVSHKSIPSITMETHYKTITEKKLKDIRKILGYNQKVSFELGLESISKDVLDIYNKDIDLSEYLKVVKLCEKYDINLQINILLGAPFLSREEQIQDCLASLDFVFKEMPESTIAVLFPINIKQNTMLKHWQDIGIYNQISSWEFVELLHRIPEKYLNRLTIAWWGNRKNTHTDENIMQYPLVCKKCKERLMQFYSEFYCNWNPLERKRMIEEIWSTRCDCDKK